MTTNIMRCVQIRHLLVFLITSASFLMYVLRYNLSIAIIAMVTPSPESLNPNITDIALSGQCPRPSTFEPGSNSSSNQSAGNLPSENGEFTWDAATQGTILSFYFIGYTKTQVLGGRLADRWSGKWALGLGMLLSSLFTLITPLAARGGVVLLCAVRFFTGASQGLIFSAAYVIFGLWIPQSEIGVAVALLNAGGNLGAMFALPTVAWMSSAYGWSLNFYVFGALTLVWCAVWACCITDNPADHKWITEDELTTITSSRKIKPVVKNIPWLKILSSSRVWACSAAKITSSFGYFVISTMLPSYLNSVLHVEITNNGLFNSVVYLLVATSLILSGAISDKLIRKQFLTVTAIRKIFQTLAMAIPCVAFALIPLAECDLTMIIVLIGIAMFFFGCMSGGEYPITTEFAPDITGSVYGVCNSFSCIGALLAPLICGWFVDGNENNRHKWNEVFYLASALFAAGAIVFDIFASATVDPKLIIAKDTPAGNQSSICSESDVLRA